ncbi:ABC-type transport auxiliary lipoprotein family protein [Tatlockia sp. PL877]|uniref:ABC-type transport auxiliary lipoprotein family protein n=1 Tax=Legionella sp. W10-070 TaxID=1117709 RepID=UPI001F5F7331|nr:ABC-type transport auxiliary lipoprotein family protein [Legionella sp. W10-070]MDI9818706.1 ABC-type transport auxiliary lipoprotein family protein [Legionella sp. PL877]
MKKFNLWLLLCIHFLLIGCAVKPLVTSQYKLAAYSKKQMAGKATKYSIFVNTPVAAAGYKTEEMLYTKKPFELMPFVHNAWVDPPAEMLLPLIVQSLNCSGYFHAVASSPSSETTDYRLDTQLIELQQSFLTKPSRIHLVVKAVLTRVDDNRIIASRIICPQVTCPIDSPYGGVLAANRATELFTTELTNFIVMHVKQDAPQK